MLPKIYRLKKKSAFNATYRTGNSFRKGGVTLFCGKVKPEGQEDIKTKIGFVVSKKIHKRAVKRNRIKRLMRESVRLYLKSNSDTKYLSLIFVASAGLLEKDFNFINTNITELMRKIR